MPFVLSFIGRNLNRPSLVFSLSSSRPASTLYINQIQCIFVRDSLLFAASYIKNEENTLHLVSDMALIYNFYLKYLLMV
jgi:hypothetical protein